MSPPSCGRGEGEVPQRGRRRGEVMIITPKQNVTYQSVFPYLLPWHINFELLWDGILQYNNYTAVHDVDIIVVSSEILYTYLALTKLSLDILASISAVSINNMDCLSKIVDMAWTREREEKKDFQDVQNQNLEVKTTTTTAMTYTFVCICIVPDICQLVLHLLPILPMPKGAQTVDGFG